MDYVDRVRAQWAERLPAVDTSPADVVARITRIAALVTQQSEVALADHDLTRPEFDVLATLRRAGRPLRAGEIQTLHQAPGASVTKRVDRLERAGLVERTVPERDRRGVLVALTPAGVALVDAQFPAQVERERAVLADLDADARAELARLLAVVLRAVDDAPSRVAWTA
ncbi:MarR family transcriptional regulator [Sediminihabitans luteus]|uniref:MarR family transcriptional regulator n=1 Tax=Sediminihabitans luteus TaxID=1138585 RepID=A0A2M9D128_9CELL|nr:MarR family transcriptional regulator [Sediminihabitans luteus]PJJ77879.1 MarR family transcriptional regulator [Sediminihabitans luteus]GII99763.1 MarR family transcriptional regulator [Sediminihabitans luteus]